MWGSEWNNGAVIIYRGVYRTRSVDQAVIFREDWQRFTKLIVVFQISFRDIESISNNELRGSKLQLKYKTMPFLLVQIKERNICPVGVA